VNKAGSCGIIVNLDLKSYNPNLLTSTLSIKIVPSTGSMSRKRAKVREDFPAPVRPTIPTFSLGLTSRVIFLRTRSRPSLYLVL
jgi:hypothetical protein